MNRWFTGVHITSKVGLTGFTVIVGWAKVVDMSLCHFKFNVSTLAVDWPDEAVDKHEHEKESEGRVKKRPNNIVPTLGHH